MPEKTPREVLRESLRANSEQVAKWPDWLRRIISTRHIFEVAPVPTPPTPERVSPGTTPWLANVYAFDFATRYDRALDIVFHEINKLCWAGAFETIDGILREIELEKLSDNLLVGFLTITLAPRDKLPSRLWFSGECRKMFEQRGRSKAEIQGMMSGLC